MGGCLVVGTVALNLNHFLCFWFCPKETTLKNQTHWTTYKSNIQEIEQSNFFLHSTAEMLCPGHITGNANKLHASCDTNSGEFSRVKQINRSEHCIRSTYLRIVSCQPASSTQLFYSRGFNHKDSNRFFNLSLKCLSFILFFKMNFSLCIRFLRTKVLLLIFPVK